MEFLGMKTTVDEIHCRLFTQKKRSVNFTHMKIETVQNEGPEDF